MNLYEAAVRELGDGVCGLVVERNSWAMTLYKETDEEWAAYAEIDVWTGGDFEMMKIWGRGKSPSDACQRCVENCELKTS